LRNIDNSPVDLSEKSALLAAQEYALLGIKNGCQGTNEITRKGYLELSVGGTLVLENADKLLPEVQKKLAEYLKVATEKKCSKTGEIRRDIRLIVTASQDIESMAGAEEFNSCLFDHLSEEFIEIIPLQKRKKDIQVIAELILNDRKIKEGKDISGFTSEAISVLVNYEWPLNYEQLKQVVYRAVALCTEDQIRDEHLILDIFSFSSEGLVNLLNYSLFQKLFQKRYFPTILKNISIPIFILLTAYMLMGPENRNLANIIIWSIWWPTLLFLNAIGPRSWCSVCPLPDIGSGSHFFVNGLFAPPAFLKKYAQLLGIAGFFIILFTEYVFHMFRNPAATGYLLIAMFAGASIMGLLWGKRAWCKYLCPLGRMLSLFSPISLLELRSNKNICLNQCKTYDCIKDDSCPMGIHPSTTVNNYDCVFCLSCVKKCPYNAIHISGRVPWRGVLEKKYWQVRGGLFAILITGSVLAVNLPRLLYRNNLVFNMLPEIMKTNISSWQNLLFLTALLGYPLLVYTINYLLFPRENREVFTSLGYAYMPLAFFGLFSIYFREFINKGPNILPLIFELAGLQGKIPLEYLVLNLGTLSLLFPFIALTSLLISIYLLNKISFKVGMPVRIKRLNKYILILTALVFLFIL
jgi:polyferredoxin